tara:strand:+ start:11149 stop:11826 length:678 start_codon:yes stop_codon:yes gene_type:complete
MAKFAIEKIRTPKGIAEWVTITGEGKENLSGKLQYVANLVGEQTDENISGLKAKIEEFWEANKPKGFRRKPKSLGWYYHEKLKDDEGNPLEDDEGNPVFNKEGKIYFAFKTGTTMPKGNKKIIKTYNAKAKQVHLGDTAIGNGSVVQISGAMGIYTSSGPGGKIIDAGVTLYLDAIQIHKLVEYSEDAGFDASDDEDAFTGDDTFEGDDGDSGTEQTDSTTKPRL